MQVPLVSPAGNKKLTQTTSVTYALNGRISFGSPAARTPDQNIQGQWIGPIKILTANAAQSVSIIPAALTLPYGYLVVLKDGACDVYSTAADQASWTTSNIIIRGTVANANVTIFVLY